VKSKTGNECPTHCALPMEDLKAWVDGELPRLRQWLVTRHVAQCALCRSEAETLRHFGAEMRDLDTALPSPALRQRILASLPDAPPIPSVPSVPVRLQPRHAPRFALAGALTLVLGVGAFALNGVWNSRPAAQTNTTVNTRLTPKDDALPAVTPPATNPTLTTQQTPLSAPPTPVIEPDELSEKANRLVAAQEKAREQAENQAWRRWVKQTPELPRSASLRLPAARIALTVPQAEAENAVEGLRVKVAALGGKLYAVRSASGSTGVFGTEAESLYAAQLPTTQVKAFADALRTPASTHAPTDPKAPKMLSETLTALTAFRPDGVTPPKPDEDKKPTTAAKPQTPMTGKTGNVYLLIALRSQ
jgi:hypothetical protein